MIRLYIVILVTTGFISCKEAAAPAGKFEDPLVVRIGDFKDRRSSDSLYRFLQHENPIYRKEALLAFASIQDSAAAQKIGALLLADPDTAVRKMAAFALGQTPGLKSISALQQAVAIEKNTGILNEAIEAYGKVTKKWSLNTPGIANEGLAWSLYRAGLNNSVDTTHNKRAASLLAKDQTERTRLGAAHFFSRSAKQLKPYFNTIASAALYDPAAEVRMAAAYALRKIDTDTCAALLEAILKKDADYRVRVNAARALQAFPLSKTKSALIQALKDKNINVGITASEVIKANSTEELWIELANYVSDIRHWRMQANLYEAILKVNDNKVMINEIRNLYQQSADPYQKAALLTAMQQSPATLDFIEAELHKADTPVIRLAAASALVAFNRSSKFQPGMKKRFGAWYEKAVRAGDAAVIGTVAGALADSTLGYRAVITDASFLTAAKKNLALPKDNEALQPLEAAIAYFERRKVPAPVENSFNHAVDWNVIKGLAPDQHAVIKTSRGNITLRLLVEEAPASVANFVNLARARYFDNKFFHRVVPNFVAQAGCNRGDGWGSEDYSIRSEFSPTRYTTGSVGMASAGKDTEGTQWFITHSPTPHLDGRYTIFAQVESGIDVVHHIEVGDQILTVEITAPATPK